jgi:hypothetical protein
MQMHGGGKNAAMHGCEGGHKHCTRRHMRACMQCTKTDARGTQNPQETLSQDPEPPAQHAGTQLMCPCTATILCCCCCCCCQSQQAPMQPLHTAVSQALLIKQGRAELWRWLVHLPVHNCHSAAQHLSNSAKQITLGRTPAVSCLSCLSDEKPGAVLSKTVCHGAAVFHKHSTVNRRAPHTRVRTHRLTQGKCITAAHAQAAHGCAAQQPQQTCVLYWQPLKLRSWLHPR